MNPGEKEINLALPNWTNPYETAQKRLLGEENCLAVPRVAHNLEWALTLAQMSESIQDLLT